MKGYAASFSFKSFELTPVYLPTMIKGYRDAHTVITTKSKMQGFSDFYYKNVHKTTA